VPNLKISKHAMAVARSDALRERASRSWLLLSPSCWEKEATKAPTPADHPDRETVAVRQGTGPRATVSVPVISIACAAVAGVLPMAYFVWGFGPPR
jgi:hypothetical protein